MRRHVASRMLTLPRAAASVAGCAAGEAERASGARWRIAAACSAPSHLHPLPPGDCGAAAAAAAAWRTPRSLLHTSQWAGAKQGAAGGSGSSSGEGSGNGSGSKQAAAGDGAAAAAASTSGRDGAADGDKPADGDQPQQQADTPDQKQQRRQRRSEPAAEAEGPKQQAEAAAGEDAAGDAAGAEGKAADGEQQQAQFDEGGDPEEELEFFSVTQRRGLMLEEYSLASLTNGMQDATHLHLAGRQRPWMPLVHSLISAVMRPLRVLTQRGTERLMRRTIETEFDTEEFLEGAKGAIEQVMRRYGAQEWEELGDMVSEKMVQDMQEAHTDLREQRGLAVEGISVDVHEAALQMTCVWSRASVARFDVARAAAALQPGSAPYWNLVFVDAITTVRVRLAPAPGGDNGSGSGGEEEGGGEAAGGQGRPSTSVTQRQGVFVFARGPLPRAAVPEVHVPWFMIGWL